MSFDRVIFGKDDTQRVINVTLKEDKVYLYTQDESGTVKSEIFDYSPFVLSSMKLRPHSEQLKGKQYYKYITSTTTEKFLKLQESFQRELWLPRNLDDCFLLCEGTTYFKGLRVEDVSILSFDIETSGLHKDNTSIVYLISNTFRKNGVTTKKLFSLENYPLGHGQMIEDWCNWVREIDPSVITGHNILSYDLPYLQHCSQFPLLLGRDGSEIEFSDKISKFRKDGSQQYEYNNAKITGRDIIDTFFLSIKYDISRDFPSYGLKPIVRHLGLEKQDRTFIDASKIGQYYKNPEMWEKVKQYAIEDSEDSLKLYDLMIPSYFYMAQSIPKTFQQIINEASGSHLDALMIRSYLQDGYSQPKTSGKAEFEGAISMGRPGMYKWVKKADVASLYPSIMLEYQISDKEKDPNGYMLGMLDYFRTERLKNKALAKETNDKYYDDMQNSQKILINSLYGFLGAGFLLYNYPKGAAEVTRKGREILLKGVEWATGYTLNKVVKHVANEGTEDEEESFEWVLGEKISEGRGYELANVDTDSFSITNGKPTTKEEFAKELDELNSIYPEMIKWADDGIYEKVIVIRAKNYVLVKDGKVKYKGSALTDKKKEPAIIEMLEKMVHTLLDDKKDTLVHVYNTYIKEALNIRDISRWVTKKTITKSVLNPKRLTEQKVLDAINEGIEKGVFEGVSEGDKIWVYNAVKGIIQDVKKGVPVTYKDGSPKMIPNCILREQSLWEKDEDRMHYVQRVYDAIHILENVIEIDKFPNYTLKTSQNLLKELDKTINL